MLFVIIPYFVTVLLQDTYHWHFKHPKHFHSTHIINCIHAMPDEEMRIILLEFMKDSPKAIIKIEREHKAELENIV